MEVAEGFSKALMPIYSGYTERECEDLIRKMRNAIIDGEAERFMNVLQTFLEGNPYGNTEMVKRESYFKNNLYIVFKALGFFPRAEEQTCSARMDVMKDVIGIVILTFFIDPSYVICLRSIRVF